MSEHVFKLYHFLKSETVADCAIICYLLELVNRIIFISTGKSMQALQFRNGNLKLQDTDPGDVPDKEARVRVLMAGICATDLEILKGYMRFEGTLGHEFVGLVEECDAMPELIGRRVVGEINSGCGYCEICRKGNQRHCPNRDVLGISGRDGTFAEYLHLPAWNLHVVPDEIENSAAVFTEPLAAAYEILDQVHIPPSTPVLLIGDGRFAHLVARVLARAACQVEVVGVSEPKIRRMKGFVTKGYLNTQPPGRKYPVVIEASGSPRGWRAAMNAVESRGTIILKSTYVGGFKFNPTQLAVDEITVVGSRCGSFQPALNALKSGLSVIDLVDGEFSLAEWEKAFEKAQEPDVIKVLFRVGAA